MSGPAAGGSAPPNKVLKVRRLRVEKTPEASAPPRRPLPLPEPPLTVEEVEGAAFRGARRAVRLPGWLEGDDPRRTTEPGRTEVVQIPPPPPAPKVAEPIAPVVEPPPVHPIITPAHQRVWGWGKAVLVAFAIFAGLYFAITMGHRLFWSGAPILPSAPASVAAPATLTPALSAGTVGGSPTPGAPLTNAQCVQQCADSALAAAPKNVLRGDAEQMCRTQVCATVP